MHYLQKRHFQNFALPWLGWMQNVGEDDVVAGDADEDNHAMADGDDGEEDDDVVGGY